MKVTDALVIVRPRRSHGFPGVCETAGPSQGLPWRAGAGPAAHRHHRLPGPPGTPTARLLPAAAYDPDAFRGLIDIISCLALPEQVLARPAVQAAVHREHRLPPTVPGLDRDQLLHMLTDTPAAAG